MRASRVLPALLAALFVQIAAPTHLGATTLVRRSLDRLVAGSEAVVMARVVDLHSYWNDRHDFILTDVRLRVARVMKGDAPDDLTLTVMGGHVGDVTVVVIGGAALEPGSDYVLFLGHEDLPGAPARMTVRDLVQGAFDVRAGRAVSQAAAERLAPDEAGRADTPGGPEGLDVETLASRIREIGGGR